MAMAMARSCDLSLGCPLCVRRQQGDGSLTSILVEYVSRLHISIHNNIYHAIAYYPTYHRAEGVQSKAKSFSCPNLPEPRPLDADVRDLSALGVPATQEMRLLRCRTEPSVRHDFHRAQRGGRRGLHGGNEV